MKRSPEAFAVCMGMDALRLSLGIPLKNFAVNEVLRWLNLRAMKLKEDG